MSHCWSSPESLRPPTGVDIGCGVEDGGEQGWGEGQGWCKMRALPLHGPALVSCFPGRAHSGVRRRLGGAAVEGEGAARAPVFCSGLPNS